MSGKGFGFVSFSRRPILASAGIGLLYGLCCRFIFTNNPVFSVVTIGFLVGVPAAVGFITVFLATRGGRSGPAIWLGLPVLTTVALLLGSFLLFWEGIICLTLLSPLAIVMAWIGGALGYFFGKRPSRTPLACVAILPLVVSAAEQRIGPVNELRFVSTSIAIQAPPAVVWEQIKRVPPIAVNEQRFSWSQKIGFPRPIEATLTGEGPGAVRHATFAGGVLFIETVTHWEPHSRLGFDIRADTARIPPRTLDEHVTIGGRYFDTLHGEYRIEPCPDGSTILHLESRHRLSTTLNSYARLWTDAIMRDIEDNILYVIRNRCERLRSGAFPQSPQSRQ